jgi:hypothetical protein
MSADWQYQLRIHLSDDLAGVASTDRGAPVFRPLADLLDAHDATLVSQFDAFAAYVAEAEREGPENYPLYKWTKATLDDPERRAKHMKAFSLHVSGQDVYPKATADALEAALQPLVDSGLVARLSRHDTNPVSNLAVPAEYRS